MIKNTLHNMKFKKKTCKIYKQFRKKISTLYSHRDSYCGKLKFIILCTFHWPWTTKMVSYLVSNMCNTYTFHNMNSYLLKQTIMVTEMQAYHRNTFFFSTFDKILWQTKMESCSKLEWMLDLTDESKPQTSSEICWILLLN